MARVSNMATHRANRLLTALEPNDFALTTMDVLAQDRPAVIPQIGEADAGPSPPGAENVATLRYRGGVSTYLEVITAQEQRLLAELALAETKGQQHQAVVQLYRALGGGWNMKEKDAATPAEQAPAPAAPPVTPG